MCWFWALLRDVMLIGLRGIAFDRLMWTLSKLVQAQPATVISAEELPADDRFLRRLVFIKIEPDAVLPLVKEKNAWILVVAINEDSGKMPALFN